MADRVVIIGAVALGPKAASRYKRLVPSAEVTMVDMSPSISYGGCGIPFYVSGDVSTADELKTTSFHVVRTPAFFETAKGVHVRPSTRAVSLDRQKKEVLVEDLNTGAQDTLPYDKLVIATGSSPRKLPIPGTDLEGVHAVSGLDEAVEIREKIQSGSVSKAVIVGSGFIGLEMAEALSDMWGIDTTVVEITDQLLPGLVSPHLAEMARRDMEENDITFHFGEKVTAMEGEDGRVTKVVTDKRTLEADLVILSVGVAPNDGLARDAGLDVHERGGIIVDDELRTSDPDIYAGGDCVVVKNLITGQPVFLPMGSMANRQGRIIADNLTGRHKKFPGVLGSWAVKLFEIAVSGVGLTMASATRAGFDPVNVHISQLDRAHFYPEKGLMYLDLVVDKKSSKVLGIQGLSIMRDALVGRINAVAAALPFGITVDDLQVMEFAYSPPFSAAMDIVNSAGNVAANVLDGINRGLPPEEFAERWADRESGDICFLDVRADADSGPLAKRLDAPYWKAIPQDELPARMDEVPRGKKLVLVCNTGARSYEAQVMLDAAGIKDSENLQGGMASARMLGTAP
ncbi:FAD-dependent oxidoreductase [Oceanidesulfovibrio marinus]|uniref:Pyridine nucleotide-disulfide oxidoreductase n=1 Tax=Oceanidesulfovibrio marinus TaxID=370038 RepID=A0A6P1ZCZ2_9BACT|nr:FAD-dependent oxidoreductase [Oceanidesulfovibrio marinus]TVM31039.1 pyridine nucleotide-disulfide oxidoreductase [Oceanidesulfovibrio marinus]